MSGKLFLVAVPIGNLSDITLRAIETLRSVDAIIAEDTRTTRRLLQHHQIDTAFYSSLYQGAERQRIGDVLGLLEKGRSLALVSDAGTPLISDPGFPLVRAVVDAGFEIVPIPGACAAIAAVVGAGLPTDRFRFIGSLPRKEGERRSLFGGMKAAPETTIAYESPHRLESTLSLLAEVLPNRRIVLARELTKIHEEFLRGTPEEILGILRDRGGIKGECVLVFSGSSESDIELDASAAIELIELMHEEGISSRSMQRILMRTHGMARNEAYSLVQERLDNR